MRSTLAYVSSFEHQKKKKKKDFETSYRQRHHKTFHKRHKTNNYW